MNQPNDPLLQQFDKACDQLTEAEVDACRKEAYSELPCSPGCTNNCGEKLFADVEAAGGKAVEPMLLVAGYLPHQLSMSIIVKVIEAAEKKRLRDLTEFDINTLKGTPWDRN